MCSSDLLLKKSVQKKLSSRELEKFNLDLSKKLESTLEEYGVEGRVVNYKSGPVVTLFEFVPAAGVKTSKIVGLSEDIARAMSSISTRIATQPGKTARNFNPPAAMCGKVCVVEVEEIVPTGALDPDLIHLPGIYVHRIIQGEHEKRIEQRTTRPAA